MSNINYAAIDVTYPIAGQDNNSQGFRDNFAAIQTALSEADAAITNLEAKALLNTDIGVESTDPAINDLLGSSITNGSFNQFYSVINADTITTSVKDVDLRNGSFQTFTYTANRAIRFNYWPSELYAVVRLHLINESGASRTPTFSTVNNGTIHMEQSFPEDFTVLDATQAVVEAWSYDGGLNVYMRLLGVFDAPVSA
jgi:hypothetical protein